MSIFKKRIRMNSDASINHEMEASSVIEANAITENASADHEAEASIVSDVNTTTENCSEVHSMDNNNKTIEKLKDILEKRWEEQEDKEGIPYEEKFQELVDEAVFMIKDDWQKTAECGYECRERLNGEISINAVGIFFISKVNRNIYTSCVAPTYPKTGKSCFFESLNIPTSEEEKRFVDCVMAKLPPNTTYEMNYWKRDGFFSGNYYSFAITFDTTK